LACTSLLLFAAVGPRVAQLAVVSAQLGNRVTLLMQKSNLEFGQVETFKRGGFGFVSSLLQGTAVFFRIETIKRPDLRKLLEDDLDNDLSNHCDYDIYFWYTVKETQKGLRVSEIWYDISEVPRQELAPFIHNLADEVAHSYCFSSVHYRLFSQLFGTSGLKDEQLQIFLDSNLFIENPETVLSFLRSSQTAYFAERLNLPQIWNDIDNDSFGNSIHEVTERLLGKEQYEALKSDREQKRQTRATAEKARQEAKLRELAQHYKLKPNGIRNELLMRNVCLRCDSLNVKSRSDFESYFRVCQDCGNEWYVNDCWNCGDGHVDSRDPETPQCKSCGWYQCKICGACQQGCTARPFKLHGHWLRRHS
jgi:hypothetical protein